MADAWTIASALATVGATVAVSWQAFETRKSTATASGALLAAQATAIDAARQRLDAGAPRVELSFAYDGVYALGGEHLQWLGGKWDTRSIWRIPEDDTPPKSLCVLAEVSVVNYDSRPVAIEFEGDLAEMQPSDPAQNLFIEPGEHGAPGRETVRLHITRTPGQWVENYRAYELGNPLPHIANGIVRAVDYRDHGVIDIWRPSLTALPIRPGDDDSTWRLPGDDELGVAGLTVAPHKERSYWLSISSKTSLPEPIYDPPSRRRNRTRGQTLSAEPGDANDQSRAAST